MKITKKAQIKKEIIEKKEKNMHTFYTLHRKTETTNNGKGS